MATVQRFEELVAWKTESVFSFLPFPPFIPFTIAGDACAPLSSSPMGGKGWNGGKVFASAKASCGEVRAQLYIANDIGYLNIQTFKYLNDLAEQTSRLTASFIRALKSSPNQGLQRKREMTKEEKDTEEFLRNARKELSKTLPHLYSADGSIKN